MSDQNKKRLFIAVGIPSEILQKMEAMQKEFKRFAREAKWVRPEGMHLTLKFLGYVDPDKIPEITNLLKPIAENQNSFSILVRGCGFFPNSRRPTVLWTGIVSNQLEKLQKEVDDAMEKIGFEKEQHGFTPHLTLARFRDYHGLTPLILESEKWREKELGEFTARDFTLYESILHRSGAEYQKVNTFLFPTHV
ncbi:MAG: RNA 2',3'-cyclic phosphodiesterase [Acidobacteria bacterium]|nr:MAG: RNA 2',3'-cyclic phosphodiesterase [Acidobacteriota bacterium]